MNTPGLISENHIYSIEKHFYPRTFVHGKNFLAEPTSRFIQLYAHLSEQIQIELDKDGIGYTSCTCPYDWGGICKHIVAALLACIQRPQQIEAPSPRSRNCSPNLTKPSCESSCGSC